jgi:hypothetical protein
MIDHSDRKITAREALVLKGDEKLSATRHGGLAGMVTMRDDKGRLIFQKRPNLIVLRGRTFALEMLFDNMIGSSGVTGGAVPYISDNARNIMAFGVGSGGASGSSPFTPDAPPPTGQAGVELVTPIPFRFHDSSQSASGDPTLFIPGGEIANYGGAVQVPGGSSTQVYYYLKNFAVSPPAWYFSESANTVYKAVELTISGNDCETPGGNQVNELCLYFSRLGTPDANGACTFLNPEMFSRITFPTEYFTIGKGLNVEYRIYA